MFANTAQKRSNTLKPWRNSRIYKLFVFMQTLWEKIKHKGHSEKPWNDSRWRKTIFLQESFSCEFYDKRFRQLSNKKKHELPHTGEKPYSCQFYDKKFRVQSNMKVHEKRCEIKPNEKYWDIDFMLPSATDRKLESKSLKSKKLNKEVYKIIKVENELLVSDNFTGISSHVKIYILATTAQKRLNTSKTFKTMKKLKHV